MEGPIIIQGDLTLLLEVSHPLFQEAREAVSAFAELVKSPAYLHTYRITPLTLWNAASLGFSSNTVLEVLTRFSKFPFSEAVKKEITQIIERYGKIRLVEEEGRLFLACEKEEILNGLLAYSSLARELGERNGPSRIAISSSQRGSIKQTLLKLGYPVQDLAGYSRGENLPISYKTLSPFTLRAYQKDATDAFFSGGTLFGGNGVVVLPCGSGKTIIGIETMVRLGMETLILTGNTTSVHQWKEEILSLTTLTEEQIGIYTGAEKKPGPVTITTYQMVTYRTSNMIYPHLDLFHQRNWGLIIYDEVHLLPAPVFRLTADLQAKRRLGLTATLIREDGREGDVFSLIGPKKFELPWRILEEKGFIANAECTEIRVPMPEENWTKYNGSPERVKFRIAAENPGKLAIIKRILQKHKTEQILIIGQYVSQLEFISRELGIPLITGKTQQKDREELYFRFRTKQLPSLIVSRVANYAVNLPDASVAIQVSGTFGSRQEEAQRLGRILRPKENENKAFFYTIVSEDSNEETFAHKRQMFLVEQGYSYQLYNSFSWQ